jgi:hypothetical protein
MLKKFLFSIVLVLHAFPLFGLDYDCIFIGSSPISLFEAMYQHSSGNKVLILDDSPVLGGAWKSIEICGVQHVDAGCHDIGKNNTLKEFLEIYGGCQMIQPCENSGFYFSRGCYELISNLQEMIGKMAIDVLLNTRAEEAILDEAEQCVIIRTKDKIISARKVYISAYSFLPIGNVIKEVHKAKYYHLYLLINDATTPRFAYQNRSVAKTTRMMNLTWYVDLDNTGQQLIVFQTHGEPNSNDGQQFLDELKERNLVSMAAYILRAEAYTYEQWPSGLCQPRGNDQPYFETLKTHHFQNMIPFLSRWKQALMPFASF